MIRPVFAVLATGGSGPVTPLPLLLEVAAVDGVDAGAVLGVLDTYAPLLDRICRDGPLELVGLVHPTLLDHLTTTGGRHWVDTTNTRRLVLDAVDRLEPVEGIYRDNPLARWAAEADVHFYWAAGDAIGAYKAMRRRPLPTPRQNLDRWTAALPRMVAALGPGHRYTLATRGNVAFWTGECGNGQDALRLFRELLPDQVNVLGVHHPDTLTTRSNIAAWTGECGNGQEALRLFRELLPDEVKVLGVHHPDTLATRGNIATWTGECGNGQEALRLFRELLPDRVKVLGAHHPDTLATRGNIATWTGECGNGQEALSLYRELLPDQVRVLGADHPDTVTTRRNIAFLEAKLGQEGPPSHE